MGGISTLACVYIVTCLTGFFNCAKKSNVKEFNTYNTYIDVAAVDISFYMANLDLT